MFFFSSLKRQPSIDFWVLDPSHRTQNGKWIFVHDFLFGLFEIPHWMLSLFFDISEKISTFQSNILVHIPILYMSTHINSRSGLKITSNAFFLHFLHLRVSVSSATTATASVFGNQRLLGKSENCYVFQVYDIFNAVFTIYNWLFLSVQARGATTSSDSTAVHSVDFPNASNFLFILGQSITQLNEWLKLRVSPPFLSRIHTFFSSSLSLPNNSATHRLRARARVEL